VSDPPRRPPDLDALAGIVAGESRRILSEAALDADPARVAEGWERRFVADGRRAEEAMALYGALGFEVVADPIRVDGMDPECEACQVAMLLNFKTIYTRKRKGPAE
jgi:hypothetical protein